jgi:hypothetical protein
MDRRQLGEVLALDACAGRVAPVRHGENHSIAPAPAAAIVLIQTGMIRTPSLPGSHPPKITDFDVTAGSHAPIALAAWPLFRLSEP